MLLPIRDHNPSQRRPYVTYGLIALNVIIFLAYWPVLYELEFRFILDDWAIVPAEVLHGDDWHTWITAMFLHGGIAHLLGNMLYLYIFGDNLEDVLGPWRFLLFYLACGIGASVFQVFSDPYSLVPSVGASGAIAGVMGGYLLLYPKAKIDIAFFIIVIFIRAFVLSAWIVLGIWFGLQVFFQWLESDTAEVAYWAHIGGFLVGVVFVFPTWLRLGGTKFWSRHHGHPPHPETERYVLSPRVPTIRRKPKE